LPTTILLFDTEDKTFHRMRRTAWEEDLKGELDDAPRGHWDD